MQHYKKTNIETRSHPPFNYPDYELKLTFLIILLLWQILSDEEKRRQFDLLGHTGQQGNGRPIYDPHSGFSFFFNGMPFQDAWSQPGDINFRAFQSTIIPESYEKPFLLEVTSDWCFACKCATC